MRGCMDVGVSEVYSKVKDAEEAALGSNASGTSVYLILWKPYQQNGRDRKAERATHSNNATPSVL